MAAMTGRRQPVRGVYPGPGPLYHSRSRSMLSGMNHSSAASPGTAAGPITGPDDSLRTNMTPSLQGNFYPYKLTATLSALKIVVGCVLIGLGAAAIIQRAGRARHAAGIWAGVAVIISGVLGAYSVRRGAMRAYVISFLCSSLVTLLTSLLVIIYSATGLVADAAQPYGVIKDEKGDIIPVEKEVEQDQITYREATMLINTLLIITGFLDIIFSIPSVIICLRELCHCYNPSLLTGKNTGASGDWLLSWLGNQNQIFYSHSSGVPYGKLAGDTYPMMTPAPATPMTPYTSSAAAAQPPPFIQIPAPSTDVSGGLLPTPSSRFSDHHHHNHRLRSRSKSPSNRQIHGVNRHQVHQHVHQPHQQHVHQQPQESPRVASPSPHHHHHHHHGHHHHHHHGQQQQGKHHHHHHHHHQQHQTRGHAQLEDDQHQMQQQRSLQLASQGLDGGMMGGSGYMSGGYPGMELYGANPGFYPFYPYTGQPHLTMHRPHHIIGYPSAAQLMMAPPTSWFYPPMAAGGGGEWGELPPTVRRDTTRKRSRSKSTTKEVEGAEAIATVTGSAPTGKKKKKGPSDSDIEKTYTGMDRELAEEFIEQTMEPTVLVNHHTVSGTESEAW